MTSDINGTVTGLQGNAVSSASPTDGYVLTWDATDGYWVARPPVGLRKDYFTSNGNWTAPAGVTAVLLIGSGGGGGGGRGDTQGAGGGGAAIPSTIEVSVTPGTVYTVSIGAGGTGGGAPGSSDGGFTTFGSLATFVSASGGSYNTTQNPGQAALGTPFPFTAANLQTQQIGMGGFGGNPPAGYNAAGGSRGLNNSLGGGPGANSGSNGGGGGGGGGGQGNGGTGGAGNNAGNGSPGSSAGANTGAGGGGGGGGTIGNAAGGNGGSGYLYIVY